MKIQQEDKRDLLQAFTFSSLYVKVILKAQEKGDIIRAEKKMACWRQDRTIQSPGAFMLFHRILHVSSCETDLFLFVLPGRLCLKRA